MLNNVVVIATGGLFIAASGPGELTPATITAGQVWLLGIGTTLGIAVQALVLLPLLGRARRAAAAALGAARAPGCARPAPSASG